MMAGILHQTDVVLLPEMTVKDAVSLFESQFGFPPSDAMGHPALLVDLRADILDPAFGTRSAAA